MGSYLLWFREVTCKLIKFRVKFWNNTMNCVCHQFFTACYELCNLETCFKTSKNHSSIKIWEENLLRNSRQFFSSWRTFLLKNFWTLFAHFISNLIWNFQYFSTAIAITNCFQLKILRTNFVDDNSIIDLSRRVFFPLLFTNNEAYESHNISF